MAFQDFCAGIALTLFGAAIVLGADGVARLVELGRALQ